MEFPIFFPSFFITFILRLDFRNICIGHFDHKDEIFFFFFRPFLVGESLHFVACEVRT